MAVLRFSYGIMGSGKSTVARAVARSLANVGMAAVALSMDDCDADRVALSLSLTTISSASTLAGSIP